MEKIFTTGSVLKEAQTIIKQKFWTVIGQFLLIGFVLGMALSIIFGRGAIIGTLITGYIGTVWVLAYVSKGSFTMDDIFAGFTFKKFIYYVCVAFLVAVSVIGGLILLIVPGIIFAVRLMFAKYIAVETGIKPMDALRESKRITNGYRWQLFWFSVVIILINILGLLCLIVGIFYTAPLSAIATGIIYKKLSQKASAETVVDSAPAGEDVIVETVEVVAA